MNRIDPERASRRSHGNHLAADLHPDFPFGHFQVARGLQVSQYDKDRIECLTAPLKVLQMPKVAKRCEAMGLRPNSWGWPAVTAGEAAQNEPADTALYTWRVSRGKDVVTVTSASRASSGRAWGWSKSCRKEASSRHGVSPDVSLKITKHRTPRKQRPSASSSNDGVSKKPASCGLSCFRASCPSPLFLHLPSDTLVHRDKSRNVRSSPLPPCGGKTSGQDAVRFIRNLQTAGLIPRR